MDVLQVPWYIVSGFAWEMGALGQRIWHTTGLWQPICNMSSSWVSALRYELREGCSAADFLADGVLVGLTPFLFCIICDGHGCPFDEYSNTEPQLFHFCLFSREVSHAYSCRYRQCPVAIQLRCVGRRDRFFECFAVFLRRLGDTRTGADLSIQRTESIANQSKHLG